MARDEPVKQFVENIQVLRFVAAFMVLLSHAQHESAASAGSFVPAFKAPFDLVTGVDIFFVISGFVMFYLSHDRFGQPSEARHFLLRRIIRLTPIYWLFTALMVAATFIFPAQLAKPDISIAHLLASLAFIPWPDQAGEMYPPLILGWTLNYEALFYVLFACALFLPRRAGICALVAVFVILTASHAFIPARMQILNFWSNSIILEFLMGIALAAVYVSGFRVSVSAGLAIAVGGFGLLSLFYLIEWQPAALRFVWGGVPALIICGGLALSEQRSSGSKVYQFLVLCGSASYSLYLSHLFTVKLIGVVWRKLSLGMPWAMLATTSIAAVFVSLIVYIAFEKPVTSWLHRTLTARRPLKSPKIGVLPRSAA